MGSVGGSADETRRRPNSCRLPNLTVNARVANDQHRHSGSAQPKTSRLVAEGADRSTGSLEEQDGRSNRDLLTATFFQTLGAPRHDLARFLRCATVDAG